MAANSHVWQLSTWQVTGMIEEMNILFKFYSIKLKKSHVVDSSYSTDLDDISWFMVRENNLKHYLWQVSTYWETVTKKYTFFYSSETFLCLFHLKNILMSTYSLHILREYSVIFQYMWTAALSTFGQLSSISLLPGSSNHYSIYQINYFLTSIPSFSISDLNILFGIIKGINSL